ncbi:HAD hydrolase-like protein [Streptomyces sp. NPDC088747]|uniref:HAD hydrolase-like protein n=1 Tax=Streptomyces sp. NPDC088747 TaxID=3365886 RepID=UPI0038009B31
MFNGLRLRQARAVADGGQGISAAELARRIGATKAQVIAYENGSSKPDPRRIRALADALGVEPLQLSDTSDKAEWSLADRRRAQGMTAAEVSSELKLSLRAYRRLEAEGLVPARRLGVLDDLAALLRISVGDVEGCLARAPMLAQRLDEVREPLTCLLHFYLRPRILEKPQQDDDEIIALADLYRRPPLVLARILSYEIDRLRTVQRRQANYRTAADFGATVEAQDKGHRAALAESRKFRDVIETLPQRLDEFFRVMLPQDVWRLLALMYALRPLGGWLPGGRLQTQPQSWNDVPSYLLDRRAAGKDAVGEMDYRISEQGSKHCSTYRQWYDACYPAVQLFVQSHERALAGHMRESELSDLLYGADAVLFSFDGLLCRLFGQNLQDISDRLLQRAQSLRLALAPQTPTDPVGMLRSLVPQGSASQIRRLDGFLTHFEIEAAQRADPLPGVEELLKTLIDGAWRLAVVTDHSSMAVEAFLERLPQQIPSSRIAVVGRSADLELTKPNPHALRRATTKLNVANERALVVGESADDAKAAQSAGITFVGIAQNAEHARVLRKAGVTRTVESLDIMAALVREQASG